MSASETSLNLCFCLLLIMEKAMSSVSSCVRRGAVEMGRSSPPMRMKGCEPALQCRSDAPKAAATRRSSSILTGIRSLLKKLRGQMGNRGDSTHLRRTSHGPGTVSGCFAGWIAAGACARAAASAAGAYKHSNGRPKGRQQPFSRRSRCQLPRRVIYGRVYDRKENPNDRSTRNLQDSADEL